MNNKIEIVTDDDEYIARLKYYAQRFEMKFTKKRGKVIIESDDAMNFYLLGANIGMPAYEGGISRHV